jgi:MFS family permease
LTRDASTVASTVTGVDQGTPAPTRQLLVVFTGLGLGTLIAGLNMTLVATGMPRIIADLGGIELYSWIAIGAVLTSTISAPIAGKLSDLYGRKPFFIGGIIAYVVASTVCGLAPTTWVLVVGRLLQGVGMGAIGPLAQAIIGDIVSARERGKYQGFMSALSGTAIILGPFVGGAVTDHFSWRMLFFLNLPFALAAIVLVGLYLQVEQPRRRHAVDYPGIVLFAAALVSVLLATQSGGSRAFVLYAAAAVLVGAFVRVEARAAEPLLPPGLWRNPGFAWANVASLSAGMASFGSVYFLPVFAQGVLGTSSTAAGSILVPLLAANVVTSIVNGLVVTQTGRYKPQLVAGTTSTLLGFVLLVSMDTHSDTLALVRSALLLGVGFGVCAQTLVLVSQNSVSDADLGVATSAVSLFRSIGSTTGVTVMGAIFTAALAAHLGNTLPGGLSANAAFDPTALAGLPPETVTVLRGAMGGTLRLVFLAGSAFALLGLIAAVAIPEQALRREPAVRLRRA